VVSRQVPDAFIPLGESLDRIAIRTTARNVLAFEMAEGNWFVSGCHRGTLDCWHWYRFPPKGGKNREPLCVVWFPTVPGTKNRLMNRPEVMNRFRGSQRFPNDPRNGGSRNRCRLISASLFAPSERPARPSFANLGRRAAALQ
jgi:hypothetical protein